MDFNWLCNAIPELCYSGHSPKDRLESSGGYAYRGDANREVLTHTLQHAFIIRGHITSSTTTIAHIARGRRHRQHMPKFHSISMR